MRTGVTLRPPTLAGGNPGSLCMNTFGVEPVWLHTFSIATLLLYWPRTGPSYSRIAAGCEEARRVSMPDTTKARK